MLTFDITTTATQKTDQQVVIISREYKAKDKQTALEGFNSYIESNKQLNLIKGAKVYINLLNENKL